MKYSFFFPFVSRRYSTFGKKACFSDANESCQLPQACLLGRDGAAYPKRMKRGKEKEKEKMLVQISRKNLDNRSFVRARCLIFFSEFKSLFEFECE